MFQKKMLSCLIQDVYERADPVKIYLPIGAGLDIATGTWVKGFHGESILLGGLGVLTGIVGRPNKFKSTVAEFMMWSAAGRIFYATPTSVGIYDTEFNKQPSRIVANASSASVLMRDRDIFYEGIVTLTDKTKVPGDVYFDRLKDYSNRKIENKKDLLVKTPFRSWDPEKPLEIILPTFALTDSISNFSTSDVDEISNKNSLGESGANMIHARQGLAKQRLMMEAPTVAGRSNHFMLFTAHVGEKLDLASNPYAPIPQKKMQHLPSTDKIKGVTDAFLTLLSNCWHIAACDLLVNKDKEAEYPRDSDDTFKGDTDLNRVVLQQLRGKNGQSGVRIPLIVSQTDGVLPTLSEFDYIKNSDRFGLGGNLQNYYVELLPDVKLSRTTVRSKIQSDEKLCRAINIVSEMCQMDHYQRQYSHLYCTPKQLYDDLKAKGYDWDILLNTRGWWTVNDDDVPMKRLSTMDLLRMRLDKDNPEHYHPWWYPVPFEQLKA